MMRFLIFFIGLSKMLQAQVMWQVSNGSSQKWYLMQTDEFNDVKINPDVWKSISSDRPYNVNLDLYYKPENIEYSNGYISLTTKKENFTSKVLLTDEETAYLKETNKALNTKGEYEFIYSGALLTSTALYGPGYFEMRFKSSDQKGVWPSLMLAGGNSKEGITVFEGNGETPDQAYADVHCLSGCNTTSEMYSKKNWGSLTKLNETLSKGWNIASGEWGIDYIKYFINGTPVAYYKGVVTAGKTLVLSNAVSKKGYGFKNGPDADTQFPGKLDVDYVRLWGKADTSGKYKDNYSYFIYSPATIDNRELYSAEVKKKSKPSKATELKNEIGSITLLPILYNKYSLSIQGNTLSSMQVDVVDRFNEKVAGFTLSNVEYYIMDLSPLPTGPYKVKISVLGQVLEQDIPIINPEKVGEQKDAK